MPFLPVLESFGMETLGDVQHFIDENSDDAYLLAASQLAVTDLDILSSSTALLNLCLVHTLKQGKGRNGLKSVYDIINGENDDNSLLADIIMEHATTLPFMKKKRFGRIPFSLPWEGRGGLFYVEPSVLGIFHLVL